METRTSLSPLLIPSYAELLEEVSTEELLELVRKHAGMVGQRPLPLAAVTEAARRGALIGAIVDRATDFNEAAAAFRLLEFRERELLTDIVVGRRGWIDAAALSKSDQETAAKLASKGMIFRRAAAAKTSFDLQISPDPSFPKRGTPKDTAAAGTTKDISGGRTTNVAAGGTYIVPLEVCLVVHAEEPIPQRWNRWDRGDSSRGGRGRSDDARTGDRPLRSLIAFLSAKKLEQLKALASAAGFKTSSTRRVSLAADLYWDMTGNMTARFAELDERRLGILRAIYRNGGRISADDFQRLDPAHGGKKDDDYRRRYGWFPRDLLSEYLESPTYRRRPELTDFENAGLDLIGRGFLVAVFEPGPPGERDYIQYYALSEESLPVIEAHFAGELEAERDALRKKLSVPAPSPLSGVVSHGDRVLEDLLKLQLAARCGLIEMAKDGFKQRPLARLAALLDAPESRVVRLLLISGLAIQEGESVCRLPKFEPDPAELLRRAATAAPAVRSAFAALAALDSLGSWIDREICVGYLAADPEVFRLAPASEAAGLLDDLIHGAVDWGLLDVSKDGKKIRTTPLLTSLFEKTKKPAPFPPAPARPLHVQPNLEILLPFNANPDFAKKLAEFSDLAVLDRMVHFALSKESLIRGFDKGWKSETVLEFLETSAETGVPSTVRHFVESAGERSGEASVLACLAAVRCDGLGIKKKILEMKDLHAVDWDENSPFVFIRHPFAPAILEKLKKRGIFATPADVPEKKGEGSEGLDGNGETAAVSPFSKVGGPGHVMPGVARQLAEALKSGDKVVLEFLSGRRVRRTTLVTVHSIREDRVYYMDRQGREMKLSANKIYGVITKK